MKRFWKEEDFLGNIEPYGANWGSAKASSISRFYSISTGVSIASRADKMGRGGLWAPRPVPSRRPAHSG